MGYGERGPPIVKAICHAFGIRDFSARFEGKLKLSPWTKIRATWACFLRATNPEQDCEDRGQRLVEAFHEVDGYSCQLPREWSHDIKREWILISWRVLRVNTALRKNSVFFQVWSVLILRMRREQNRREKGRGREKERDHIYESSNIWCDRVVPRETSPRTRVWG